MLCNLTYKLILTLFCFSQSVLFASPVQETKDLRLLEPGKPIERELIGGQTHKYELILTAGHYLRVAVDQRGINVVVRLFAPDGKQLKEINRELFRQWAERFSWVADASGRYQLEVYSPEKAPHTGRYEAAIEEMHAANEKERVAVTAEQTFLEGEQLVNQKTTESRTKAIEKYDEALKLYRAVDDLQMQGTSLHKLARAYEDLRQPQKAQSYYEQALPIFRSANYQRGAARTLNDMAAIYSNNFNKEFNKQKALDLYNQALAIARTLGDKEAEARTLYNLGLLYDRLGDWKNAVQFYEESLPPRRVAGDIYWEAATVNNIGMVYFDSGDRHKALEYFNQAMPLRQAAGERIDELATLQNIGMTYSTLGESDKALSILTEALSLGRTLKNGVLQIHSLYNIGALYRDLGDYRKALDIYQEVLKLSRTDGNREAEYMALRAFGATYYSLREYQKALDFYQMAKPFLQGEEGQVVAEHLVFVGDAYAKLGEKQKAISAFTEALSLIKETGTLTEGDVLVGFADIYLEMGAPEKALEYLRQALPISQKSGNPFAESEALWYIARAESALNHLNEARNKIEEAIKTTEGMRTKVSAPELRATYLSRQYRIYSFYVDLLMQLQKHHLTEGFDTKALEANERSRARSLLDLLTEARAEITQGSDPELLKREKFIRQQLEGKEEYRIGLLNSKQSQEALVVVEKELTALRNDYDDVRYQIRASSPRYAALTQPQPLTVKEIQQQVLDPDTLLLEYSLGEERSYLWVASQTSLNHFVLPKAAEIEKAARRVYELLTAPNQVIKGETPEQQIAGVARAETGYAAAAAELSRLILTPAADLLGKKRLLIVTDGALQYIPFSALPAPANASQPLALTNEVVYLPSASTLAILRRELASRQAATKAVAVLADPVFSRDDSRLTSPGKVQSVQPVQPEETATSGTRDLERAIKDSGLSGEGFRIPRLLYSRREAEAIATAAKGTAFKALDFDASRAVATSSDLSQYRIVHFATHGLLNSEHPELSGIVLSLVNRQGEPQNGFLRLQDVFNLRLNADLVVLSACQTGLGKEIKGEGLIGLTRGFMYAGAARVLASLWKVDDAATAELMKRFYGKVLSARMRPAAALREAQMEMWQQKRWRSPYFWAAFTLQGEWR